MRLYNIVNLVVPLLILAACGGPQMNNSQRLMNEAWSQASLGAPSSLSAEEQLALVLNHAFPQSGQVIVTETPSFQTVSPMRGVVGTLPNGASYYRNGGAYVTPSGYNLFTGGAGYYNPNTGVGGRTGGFWIPGVGAAGFAAGINPQTGKLGIGFCYGSLAYSSSGCWGCSVSGCGSF
ncbi:MAG: hypothetical protein HYR96_11605 [Deltaproteobacteria bacterium]|nr:hypothetical protein [Deltaproteobacteria bacterium]MBI3294948.1 hypothetical protein [Deltaproteobacteria bacterium]